MTQTGKKEESYTGRGILKKATETKETSNLSLTSKREKSEERKTSGRTSHRGTYRIEKETDMQAYRLSFRWDKSQTANGQGTVPDRARGFNVRSGGPTENHTVKE